MPLSYLINWGSIEIKSGAWNSSVLSQFMVTFLSFTLAVQSPLESGDENGIVNFSGFSNVSSLVPSIIYLPVVEHLFEAIFVIVIEGKLSIFVKSSFLEVHFLVLWHYQGHQQYYHY